MFRRITFFSMLALVALGWGTACGGAPTPTLTAGYASALTDTYTDALSIKNQLAVGILKLDGTPHAVTKEQSLKLVALWQTSKSLTASGTASTPETNAVLAQMEQTLTPAQLGAIKDLKLTNATLQALYVEWGLSDPATTPTASGAGKTLSTADKEATRTASGVTTSSTGKGTVVLDKVIEYLTARATK